MKSPHHLKGRYRECVLDLDTKEVTIHRSSEWERQNLDFPVTIQANSFQGSSSGISGSCDIVCMRSVSDDYIADRLVFFRGLQKIGEFRFRGRFFCGEPAWDRERKVLCGLAWDMANQSRSFFWELEWPSMHYSETELDTDNGPLLLGFHSGVFSGI
jgi:hypothetical protein